MSPQTSRTTKKKPRRTEKPRTEKASKRPPHARARGATGVQLGADTARSLVLQGAAVVLARKGARLTSVEDILAASGVSRRTFYRFFEGKDDVMLALYQVGTQGLLTACRAALEQTTDVLSRLERCIDVHLGNARVLPRLVFVLGGEAQHHESPLHPLRLKVHAELCSLLIQGRLHPEPDVWVIRGLVLALEGLVRFALEEGDEGRAVSEQSLQNVKRAMMEICAQLSKS